jgi:Flp pilus assembly protein TadG
LLRRFRRDESGGYLLMASLMMPVLVGLVGLGTESGLWMYKHRTMQNTADSGAYSAATAYVKGIEAGGTVTEAQLREQARAVAATYGFVHGANDVTVTVNWPYAGDQKKVEVIVAQPQIPLFSGAFRRLISSDGGSSTIIRARALAAGVPAVAATAGTPGKIGNGCILVLNKTASGALTLNGTADAKSSGCSVIVNSSSSSALTATGSSTLTVLNPQSTDKGFIGVVGLVSAGSQSHLNQTAQKVTAMADPYAGVSSPNYANGVWTVADRTSGVGCDLTAYSPGKGDYTIGPSLSNPNKLFVICGGMNLNAGVKVTLRPGIYIFDQDKLQVNGNSTLTGTGVTLIFTTSTGSNYAHPTLNGGAIVTLSAPTSGPTKGLVFYGDRRMPVGTSFQLNGGSQQTIDGAIYAPNGSVQFAGGDQTSNACTQLVSDTITFTGNAFFKIGCSNATEAIGSTAGTPDTPGTPETVMLIE